MAGVWRFIVDNKDTLSWLGGGVVVVAGGAWTVAKFLLKREKPKSVDAGGGVAAGRDLRGNTITITQAARAPNGPEA